MHVKSVEDQDSHVSVVNKFGEAVPVLLPSSALDQSSKQDNDPKHTALIVKLWLLYYEPNQLRTPPQSPDLNPIEHLWGLLERRIREHVIASKEMLKSVLVDEWKFKNPCFREEYPGEGQVPPTSVSLSPTTRDDLMLNGYLEYPHIAKALYIYKHP
ncbi:transposable element Tc1 transposase [Trichonephila clavipes]|nr:transposable element Tc1 transposase [Trichonephila clavipes]